MNFKSEFTKKIFLVYLKYTFCTKSILESIKANLKNYSWLKVLFHLELGSYFYFCHTVQMGYVKEDHILVGVDCPTGHPTVNGFLVQAVSVQVKLAIVFTDFYLFKITFLIFFYQKKIIFGCFT